MRQGLCNGTVTVRTCVCPIYRPLHAAVGLLLRTRRVGDVDQQRRSPNDQQHGVQQCICEQCHVVS